jgi:4-diphosphocytidyl-2-C-methyl-D-erythritol kinase
MGLEIGADVPFFFFEGAAIASGMGEQLKRISLPELWYILIYPNFEVSTRWAYQNFLLTKKEFHFSLNRLWKTPQGVSRLLSNDLEKVVSRKYPQIDVMKEMLYGAGALGASMTGSGPTVFGIFSEEGGASEAYKKIKETAEEKGWIVINAQSIST